MLLSSCVGQEEEWRGLHHGVSCAEALHSATAASGLSGSSEMYVILISHDALGADSWFFWPE